MVKPLQRVVTFIGIAFEPPWTQPRSAVFEYTSGSGGIYNQLRANHVPHGVKWNYLSGPRRLMLHRHHLE